MGNTEALQRLIQKKLKKKKFELHKKLIEALLILKVFKN